MRAKPTSYSLPAETIEKIDLLSRSWEVPVSKSAVVRMAIDEMAKRRSIDRLVRDRQAAMVGKYAMATILGEI